MEVNRLRNPIFLMCSERSGSNLITKIFDAHPDVTAPGTSHLFAAFSELACRYREGDPALRSDILDLFQAKISSWKIDALPLHELLRSLDGKRSAAEMIAVLINMERLQAGKERTFIKENCIHKYIPFLESISDNPSYVFMVRDPRDMAVSWKGAAVLRGGIVRSARRWVSDQGGFVKVVSWLRGQRPITFLAYEDLVRMPEPVLRKLCFELNLEFTSNMLDFALHSESARVDASRSALWRNLSGPILQSNCGRYSDELVDDQVAYVEALCGPLMRVFGFQPSRGQSQPRFGSFKSFEDLERALIAQEPHEKPSYLELPYGERARFERWTMVHEQLRARLSNNVFRPSDYVER